MNNLETRGRHDSLDSSLEDNGLWSDNPEKAYFREMMAEQVKDGVYNMDEDSILGDQTLASIEGRVNATKNSYPLEADKVTTPTESYYFQDTEAGHLFNSELGYTDYDDDISTLANDTTEGSFRAGSISKMISSIAVRKKTPNTPETERLDKESDGTQRSGSGDDYSHEKDNDVVEELTFSRKKYVCAALFAVFLLGAIGTLSYGLISLKENQVEISGQELASWDWTFKPTQSTTQSPTLSSSPTFPAPTSAPTTGAPLKTPTSIPTSTPSSSPTVPKEERFINIISERSSSAVGKIETDGSVQKTAFEWLVDDPNFYLYTDDRLVQRWTLAIVKSVTSSSSGRRLNAALDTWMKYTDECSWFNGQDACDDNKEFKSLVLKDVGLDGSIPSEIALLSELQTLILSNNDLEGTIPRHFGNLRKLNVLKLDSNRLEGKIPTNIGDMKRLDILNLENNRLRGTIPTQLGRMKELEIVELQDNRLSGTIPSTLANLSDLEELKLENNRLTGNAPLGVCDKNLDVYTTDCEADEVLCSCCTNCENNMSPQQQPVSAPVSQPGNCNNKIQVFQSCFERGEDIKLDFINCTPQGNDWIGLYDTSANPKSLPDPHLWKWSCGNQNCWGETASSTLYLDKQATGLSNWPLQPGTYKIYLVRGGSRGAHTSISGTSKITVARSCS